MIRFDLSDPDWPKLFEVKPDYLLIAAAAHSRIDETKKYSAASRHINVVQTIKLLDRCNDAGVIPIYLSTDAVFQGDSSFYRESDVRNPLNEYGRIRVSVENYILDHCENFLLLRLGRVFDLAKGSKNFFNEIVEHLSQGKTLDLANDQVFSPISIDDLSKFLHYFIENKLTGTFHLSSIRETSRYQIGLSACNYLGYDEELVRACSIEKFSGFEQRPKNTTLDTSKFRAIYGDCDRELATFFSQ